MFLLFFDITTYTETVPSSGITKNDRVNAESRPTPPTSISNNLQHLGLLYRHMGMLNKSIIALKQVRLLFRDLDTAFGLLSILIEK